MKITPRIALELASHEGLVRQAYKDSVGVWTWSVGITNASGHEVTRYIDNPQPIERCLEVWLWVLENYADDVREAFAGFDLSEAQFGAALSFNYNTGSIKSASWVRHFKAGDTVKARKAFMNWRKPPEIIPRRRKERDLFFDGKWSGDGTMTEYTRVTANHAPDWGSAKRVDVSKAVNSLLRATQAPTQPPKPSPRPDGREKPHTPRKSAPKRGMGIIVAIIALVSAAAAGFTAKWGEFIEWITGVLP